MITDHPILDEALFARLVAFLTTEQLQQLLEILRSRIVVLANMDDAAIGSDAGRMHIHRLASEAGMLGFRRLSVVCSTIEAGAHSEAADTLAAAHDALLATLKQSHQAVCRLCDETSSWKPK